MGTQWEYCCTCNSNSYLISPYASSDLLFFHLFSCRALMMEGQLLFQKLRLSDSSKKQQLAIGKSDPLFWEHVICEIA